MEIILIVMDNECLFNEWKNQNHFLYQVFCKNFFLKINLLIVNLN